MPKAEQLEKVREAAKILNQMLQTHEVFFLFF